MTGAGRPAEGAPSAPLPRTLICSTAGLQRQCACPWHAAPCHEWPTCRPFAAAQSRLQRSPPLCANYCAIDAFSAKKPDRLLSIIEQLMHFRVKSRIYGCTFCRYPFVFIHIAGSIFIFNISKAQLPVSGLEKGILSAAPVAAGWDLPSFARAAICCPPKLGAGARKRHSLPTALRFPSPGS
jgi:hypothetical protein